MLRPDPQTCSDAELLRLFESVDPADEPAFNEALLDEIENRGLDI